MEQHLDLHPSAALLLLARGVVPDLARPAEGFHALARPVQFRQAVPPPEEAEMVGREGAERSIVPAQCLGPLLLPLEVPADRAMKDGGAPRRQLGAAEEIALDLVLVAEHPEGPADLVEQLGRIPGLVFGRIIEGAVARNDRVMLAPIGERADLSQDADHVAHGDPLVTCCVVRKRSLVTWTRPAVPCRSTKSRPGEQARSGLRAAPNRSGLASRRAGACSSRFSIVRACPRASSRFRWPICASRSL